MRKKITHNRFMEKMENRIEAFRNLMNQFQTQNDLGKSLCNLFEKFKTIYSKQVGIMKIIIP
jgi:hypothetical protein